MRIKTRWLMILALGALLSGCASVEPDQFTALQSQVYHNRQKVAQLEKKLETARRPQAEIQAEIMSIQQELAELRGRVEENSHRLGQAPQVSMAQKVETEELDKRLTRLEQLLDLKPGSAAKPAATPAAKPAPPRAQTAQDIYNLGHKLRKKGSLDAARKKFEEVVKKYPKSSLADNAQYWIGDVLYSQKRYEESILAFNQVVKRYPKSGKVPAALLKQGMAFRALGDKRTAKIVFNRLIKSYPKSSQAKIAKKYLKKL
jgi:tol-pal system protein YbgF